MMPTAKIKTDANRERNKMIGDVGDCKAILALEQPDTDTEIGR